MASLGCFGVAVPHIGLSGASDSVVWRYAYENDLTVITTNAKDFLALLDVEVHPGLVVLRESGLSRQEQWDRIEPVLQHLLKLNDPRRGFQNGRPGVNTLGSTPEASLPAANQMYHHANEKRGSNLLPVQTTDLVFPQV
jgi:predicted nuclease of predicted toxin-antitoxin system